MKQKQIRIPETTAERAERLVAAAKREEERALSCESLDRGLELATDFAAKGEFRNAQIAATLGLADQRLSEWHSETLAREAAKEEARAERIAKIRAAGTRLSLPDLDAGLRR